ncbi:FAD binding domain-containing protein [Lentinula edodes]|uniref:FAD binding domain-containing protein n=2 Tax=Lentinula edodes TaxID=5353 RepID=UPI001E8D2380|nr:FAD binding domain-containing protein [Lentinula edodes]KAH7872212.1 FAD binding domain-containing protein [Lentinula edodes]
MTLPIPVLIVGAGPAGLVSALVLAQNGIQVRIVDKADRYHVGSRGFGVQPRTFELFKTLGIVDEILEASTPIPTMRAYKLPGGTIPVKTWDLYEKGEVWADRPFANGACLSQETLEEILRDNLRKYGISVELHKGLVAISQNTDTVAATLAVHNHGEPTEATELVTAHYCIGADGARGATRKLLGLTFEGQTRDADGMVWGDIEINGLGSDFWHIWGKPGQFTIMARPLSPSGNKFGIGITGQNFDPTNLAAPEKAIEFIKTETGRNELTFGSFSWLSYFKPNMRMVNKLQEGRVFLVGDSAHVHSPTGGQGMNCSVQDASNLTWKLALVLKNIAPFSFLSSYNEERIPVIAQMIYATTQLYTHTDSTKSGWFRWRNTALEMYGINYRFSSIVYDERDASSPDSQTALAHAYTGYEGSGTLNAGDRAPEAPGIIQGGQVTSLMDLLRHNLHTVLIFGNNYKEAQAVANVLEERYIIPIQVFAIINNSEHGMENEKMGVLHDSEGHAHAAYLVDGTQGLVVVIIRPDSFIGGIFKEPEGVSGYFNKICGTGN